MPDPAPMTVWMCPTCRHAAPDEAGIASMWCHRHKPPAQMVRQDVLPLADARRAVLAELTSPESVEVAWGHYSHPDDSEAESDELDAMRAALSALAAHLAGESRGQSR